MTFIAYKKTGTGKLTAASGYWEIYGSNSSAPTSSSSGTEIGSGWSGVSSITFNIASSAKYNYYTVAFNPSEYPLYNNNPVAASATVTVVVDGQNGQDGSAANTQYTDIRFRGVWNSSTIYYYATASSIGLSNYENPSNAYVRDQVIYKGGVYLVKTVNSGGVYGQTPSSSSSYWELVSSVSAMAINTLLADNAVLGAFHFSNNIFWSGDGGSSSSAAKLYMNSSTGRFVCTNASITGSITATSGTFNGTVNASGGNFSSVKINSGQIAGFEISGNHIGSSATASGSGGSLSINPDFIRVGNSTSYVMIGSDTVPATVGGAFTATGRFVNHNYNASTAYGFDSANYGLYVDVANGTKNYALYSPNAAVRAAAVYGDTINVVNITGSTYKLDMSKGNIIMIRANREYTVNLPNAKAVASMFGYNSLPTYFAIHVRIMIHPDTSGVTISGYFRSNNTANQSVYLYPGNSMGFLVTNYPSFRWVETDYAGR